MKRLLHISDLHFGRVHQPAIESLQQFLKDQDKNLDLIIMTGDWTQRARRREFKRAAEFIDQIRTPILEVPGNHDIPLYNLFSRAFQSLKRYNRFIRPKTLKIYESDDVVVVGLKTAYPFRWVEGYLRNSQVDLTQKIFSQASASAVKVVACHHPLVVPNQPAKIKPLRNVRRLLSLKPDLVLSGHSHASWLEAVPTEDGRQVLHLSAGSAISDRLRAEVNSFHILEIENKNIRITTYHLSENGFIERVGNG